MRGRAVIAAIGYDERVGPGLIALAATVVPLVTHGSNDAADPAVVAIVDATGAVGCSGTLIAPHFVLTAAHCIVPQLAHGASVVLGSSVAAPDASIPVAASRVHPAFDPATFAHDAALVVLATAAPTDPVSLGAGAPAVGSAVRIVGWGKTAADAGDVGTKRAGTASATASDGATFSVAPAPAQPCGGDSGGPAFAALGGMDSFVGITSHGDPACSVAATFTRVDSVTADFVAPTMASLGDGTVPIGARCMFSEQCIGAGVSCIAAADDDSVSYCSQECLVSSGCSGGMVCVPAGAAVGQCRHPLPTPGALGSPCASDADCADTQCTSTGVCSVRCTPGGAACPGASQCASAGGIDFFCQLPPPSAPTGCALAVAPRRLAFVPALLGLFLALTGLRRRRPASP